MRAEKIFGHQHIFGELGVEQSIDADKYLPAQMAEVGLLEIFGRRDADRGDDLVAEAVFPAFELGDLLCGEFFGNRQMERERQLGSFVACGAQIVDFEFAQVKRGTYGFLFGGGGPAC